MLLDCWEESFESLLQISGPQEVTEDKPISVFPIHAVQGPQVGSMVNALPYTLAAPWTVGTTQLED